MSIQQRMMTQKELSVNLPRSLKGINLHLSLCLVEVIHEFALSDVKFVLRQVQIHDWTSAAIYSTWLSNVMAFLLLNESSCFLGFFFFKFPIFLFFEERQKCRSAGGDYVYPSIVCGNPTLLSLGFCPRPSKCRAPAQGSKFRVFPTVQPE